MGSIVMGRRPKLKTVVVPRQKYPEACVWQPTSNLLVLFKFFVGYSFLVKTQCASTSCGVVQVADVADCPTPARKYHHPRRDDWLLWLLRAF